MKGAGYEKVLGVCFEGFLVCRVPVERVRAWVTVRVSFKGSVFVIGLLSKGLQVCMDF